MSNRLIIRVEAEADITDGVVWYQNQQAGLGEQFLAEVEVAIQKAVANPRHHPRLRRVPEVRRILLERFPFRVFFVVRTDAIIVFRVLHSARHDREWKKSVPQA
jgi:plasmid stabilization system protein ParE